MSTRRVTREHLEAIVARINRMTGSPLAQYVRTEDGRMVGQIGNFHLDGAYGGYALHRMVSEGGGVTDVLQVGHQSKAELQRLMFAFIRGMEAVTAPRDGGVSPVPALVTALEATIPYVEEERDECERLHDDEGDALVVLLNQTIDQARAAIAAARGGAR